MVRIVRVERGDPLHVQACALRDEVAPGSDGAGTPGILPDEKTSPAREVQDEEMFVAVIDAPSGAPRVVGCAALRSAGAGTWGGQVAYVVVHPQRRGEGIGRRLLVAVEARAFGELGLGELSTLAPRSAAGFYQRLGWEQVAGPDRFGGPVYLVLRAPDLAFDLPW